jgi:hypothetical protein
VTDKREKSGRALEKLVDARGHELRSHTYERLLVLEAPRERVEINGRRGTIAVIVEPCSDDRIRIVVQGFLAWSLLGVVVFSQVALDGFYKHRDNSVTPMKDKEFYDYD